MGKFARVRKVRILNGGYVATYARSDIAFHHKTDMKCDDLGETGINILLSWYERTLHRPPPTAISVALWRRCVGTLQISRNP